MDYDAGERSWVVPSTPAASLASVEAVDAVAAAAAVFEAQDYRFPAPDQDF